MGVKGFNNFNKTQYSVIMFTHHFIARMKTAGFFGRYFFLFIFIYRTFSEVVQATYSKYFYMMGHEIYGSCAAMPAPFHIDPKCTLSKIWNKLIHWWRVCNIEFGEVRQKLMKICARVWVKGIITAIFGQSVGLTNNLWHSNPRDIR